MQKVEIFVFSFVHKLWTAEPRQGTSPHYQGVIWVLASDTAFVISTNISTDTEMAMLSRIDKMSDSGKVDDDDEEVEAMGSLISKVITPTQGDVTRIA